MNHEDAKGAKNREEENLHVDNAAELVLRGVRLLINFPFVILRAIGAFAVK